MGFTMTFEDNFPELKDKVNKAWFKEVPVVIVKDIEEHCLSKQRVKEAIEKYCTSTFSKKELFKKLGLGE